MSINMRRNLGEQRNRMFSVSGREIIWPFSLRQLISVPVSSSSHSALSTFSRPSYSARAHTQSVIINWHYTHLIRIQYWLNVDALLRCMSHTLPLSKPHPPYSGAQTRCWCVTGCRGNWSQCAAAPERTQRANYTHLAGAVTHTHFHK